jgi:hypothetical protein
MTHLHSFSFFVCPPLPLETLSAGNLPVQDRWWRNFVDGTCFLARHPEENGTPLKLSLSS